MASFERMMLQKVAQTTIMISVALSDKHPHKLFMIQTHTRERLLAPSLTDFSDSIIFNTCGHIKSRKCVQQYNSLLNGHALPSRPVPYLFIT